MLAVSLLAERAFPITQSYVDIIFRGCLSVSRDFASRFLETTHGWWHDGQQEKKDRTAGPPRIAEDEHKTAGGNSERQGAVQHHTWVNDRHDPLYVRADKEYSLEHGAEIDELISRHHPWALQQRVMSV